MSSSKKKPMILIVDDTSANIEVLMGILGGGEYKISAAVNGKEGIEMAEKLLPDLILLDVMMPVMDGYTACRHLKNSINTKHIPVIFLTAKIQPEDITKGFEAGAVDYIVKPFNESELLARIENHLELKQNREELKEERNELRIINKTIEEDLNMARSIQEMAMPSQPPNASIAFHYASMAQVGGDFYTFFELSDGKLGLFISDVSGHGIAAAFITLLIKNTLQHNQNHLDDPETLMGALNENLYGQTAGNFFTAIYAIIDFKNSEIEYVTAGHNQPYIIGEEIEELGCDHKSLPMGIVNNTYLKKINKYYKSQKSFLTKGSRLLFYTDGLTEAIRLSEKDNPDALDFESSNLLDTLLQNRNESAEKIVHNVMEDLKQFRETDHFDDDVCIICAEM
ncbi:MAG: SpoIIE family protein phosphatase [Leptospirales bacterium]